MIRQAIWSVVSGYDLTEDVAADCMEEILSGEATNAQIASFLTAIRIKGESVNEIVGFAKVMRNHCKSYFFDSAPALEVCETYGTNFETFNISTLASIVATGAGANIVKHISYYNAGNCSGGELLEALGISLDLKRATLLSCLETCGIVFLLPNVAYPFMRYTVAPRKEIGIRTIFNILASLTDPFRCNCQYMCMLLPELMDNLADVISKLKIKKAFLFDPLAGIGSLSTVGTNHVCEITNGEINKYMLTAADVGLADATIHAIEAESGGLVDGIRDFMSVLDGVKGSKRDIVVFNAGAMLYMADKANSIREGVEMAEVAIDSGAAMNVLDRLTRFCKNVCPYEPALPK